jgi:polar amino acid transport system permease protein
MDLLVESSGIFLTGLLWTFKLALLTLLFATVISLFVGVMSVTGIKALRIFAAVYVEVFRDIPLLVSLFFVYFGAPLIGIPLDPFTAATVTLSLWGGANGAEIVRGGFNSVPHHQRVSAAALGLRPWEIYWFVLAPQALLPIIPPFTGLFSLLIQSTSLAALIGVPEFFRIAQIVVERTTLMEGHSPAFLVFGVVILVYYVICSLLNLGTKKLEIYMRTRTARGAAAGKASGAGAGGVPLLDRGAEESV